MLIAEFEYITQAAFQVSEDRAKVSQFYVLTVASFVAAIFGNQIQNANQQVLDVVFTVLFAVLTLNGLVTLLHLIQLRIAWLDSVTAMNKIKSYYIETHPDSTAFGDAFIWKGLPKPFKSWSISFLLAVQTAVLSALTFGAALFISTQSLFPSHDFRLVIAVVIGILFIGIQIWFYRYLLARRGS